MTPEGFELVEEAPAQPPPGFEPVVEGMEPVQKPSIPQRIMQRFMGTDIEDDPLEIPRLAAIMSGGIGGGVLGSRVPRVPGPAGVVINPLVGGILGGAAGTVAGAVSPETGMEIGEFAGVLPEGTRETYGLSPTELRTLAEGELLLDLATAGGFSAARAATRLGVRAITGAGKKDAQAISTFANKYDIAMMPVQVGEKFIPRGYLFVMGRMPWIGSPFRKAGQKAEDATREAFRKTIDRVGIVTPADELGERIFSDGQELLKAFNTRIGKAYDEVFANADDLGVYVVPNKLIEKADDIVAQIARKQVTGVTGEKGLPPAAAQKVQDFIEKNVQIMRASIDGGQVTAKQSLKQLDGLIENIDQTIKEMEPGLQRYASSLLNQLRQAAHQDMLLNVRGEAAGEIAGRLRALDTEFSEAMTEIFDTTRGKAFGSVQKQGLRGIARDEATRMPVDKLARVIIDMDSPQAMDELARLVKPETMQRVAAGAIQDALERAQPAAGLFDANVFAKRLGLDSATSPRRNAVAKMLEKAGPGITIDDLEKLSAVAQRLQGIEIPNVSTFIARRASIGGLQSVINGVVPGLALSSGGAAVGAAGAPLLGAVIAFTGLRGIASLLADPRHAQLFRNVLSEETTFLVKKQAALDLMRLGAAYVSQENDFDGMAERQLKSAGQFMIRQLESELNALGEP